MTTAAVSTPLHDRRAAASAWMFTAAVLLSALLVFLVEPLMGKLLLPVLGGSAAVWNTSLAFFQIALLVGYAYAHALQRLSSVRVQFVVHFAVLALSAAVLPLHVSGLLGAPSVTSPALWLIGTLGVTIGAPFAALSASAPLVQAWCTRLGLVSPGGKDVYGLYAASNVGSLIALVAYPTVVEPNLGLFHQSWLWSVGYGLFAAVLLVAAVSASRRSAGAAAFAIPVASRSEAAAPAVSWGRRLSWVLLSAAPSSLLLGVTAHISADVASAPFLWVVPLILYLLTFIIAFARPHPPGRELLLAQLLFAPAALVTLAVTATPWPLQLLVHLVAFTATAMVCHRTLVDRRPDPAHLTEFYLLVSVGGMLGGVFNALLAPVLFNQVWEYPVVLALAFLARPAGARLTRVQWGLLAVGVLAAAPLCLPLDIPLAIKLGMAGIAIVAVVGIGMSAHRNALAGLLLVCAIAAQQQGASQYADSYRSFFGVSHLQAYDDPQLGPVRMMVHGRIIHGIQFQRPQMRCTPAAYYGLKTAIGQVFATEQARKPALATEVIGLGAGATAAYVRPTDTLRYREIDPVVKQLASDPKVFSFINGCAKGPVSVVMGDGRLTLKDDGANAYDLLLIDAFSSDSIPTHLLTREAMAEYLRHLKPDGVVVLHLTNRNLDLLPSAAASARAAGAAVIAGVYKTPPGAPLLLNSSQKVLLIAPSAQTIARYQGRPGWGEPEAGARPWTDDYTNVLGAVLRHVQDRFSGKA